MSYIQKYGDRFDYFDRCLDFPDWEKITILDFGGNSGNLLRDPKSKIPHKNYTCLDVSLSAIELGKSHFPEAKWHHYNRWNPRFNPNGIEALKIPELGTFDIVICCSVFTHTTETDMIEMIEELRKYCKTIAFTIMTPNVAFYYAKKRNPGYEEEKMNQNIEGLASFYLIDDMKIHIHDPRLKKADSFYYILTLEHLRDLFPDVKIISPIRNEIQHCCVLDGLLK